MTIGPRGVQTRGYEQPTSRGRQSGHRGLARCIPPAKSVRTPSEVAGMTMRLEWSDQEVKPLGV